jgi:hypothetical protein
MIVLSLHNQNEEFLFNTILVLYILTVLLSQLLILTYKLFLHDPIYFTGVTIVIHSFIMSLWAIKNDYGLCALAIVWVILWFVFKDEVIMLYYVHGFFELIPVSFVLLMALILPLIM